MLRQLTSLIGIFAVAGLAVWPFVQPVSDSAVRQSSPLQTGDELKPCFVDAAGSLVAIFFGSMQQQLEVRGDALLCSGKLDSVSGRSRLAFSTEQAGFDANIVIVIGLENVLENTTQKGLPTNLTLLDQDSGLFFGTQGFGRCWTDLSQALAADRARTSYYNASGEVYCAGAIPQIQGPGSVTISALKFAGHLVITNPTSAVETKQL